MLHLKLNPSLGVPIYRQVMDGIKEMIATEVLAPGDRLPSIRELSSALRINPSSAVKAYNELKHGGVIVLDQGRGTFVSADAAVVAESRDELLTRDLEVLLDRAQTRGFSAQEVAQSLDALVSRRRKRKR